MAVEFELFEFEGFELLLLDLLEVRFELFELLLLLFEPMLARTPMMTAPTMPITTRAPMVPRTHGSALDFFFVV